ncbi:MAG: DUF1697 domain-containing protein [Bacteroidetes bacterium]|nr:DUF1697 domain-containing protein [Bacteroidota bacterium]
MTTRICLLRGVNVTGKNPMNMKELALCLSRTGMDNVSTYIQSGNVLYHSDKSIAADTETIHKEILAQWGYDLPVLVFDATQLGKWIEESPFAGKPEVNPEKLHVTYLHATPAAALLTDLLPTVLPGEAFAFGDRVVYLYCPGGYGNTKLDNTFFEKKLKVAATTRNWKTTLKLLELSRDY